MRESLHHTFAWSPLGSSLETSSESSPETSSPLAKGLASVSREFSIYLPSKRGVRGADLGVDIPSARLAMIPGVLGTALFLGVPLVEGVAGSNRGCLGGAFGIDCSADSCSCMSTSESGKSIGEDIVPQYFSD